MKKLLGQAVDSLKDAVWRWRFHHTLLGVARDLETGRIEARNFRIQEWSCGTAMCIGGHTEHRMGMAHAMLPTIASHHLSREEYKAFDKLCFRFPRDYHYLVSPEHGAQAIRNYLNGYPDPWVGFPWQNGGR